MVPPLYPILDVDQAAAGGHDIVNCAAGFAALGLGVQQLRAKRWPAGNVLRLAERLMTTVPTLVINDRVDVACLAGAAGVHLGQEDLPVGATRALLGPNALLGFSTHNHEQLVSAAASDDLPPSAPGYLAVGPVCTTTTKVNPDPVIGIEGVAWARRHYAGPLVAIGGIALHNCANIWTAGADSIAVIGALWSATDPVAAARGFLLAFEQLSCHSPRSSRDPIGA